MKGLTKVKLYEHPYLHSKRFVVGVEFVHEESYWSEVFRVQA